MAFAVLTCIFLIFFFGNGEVIYNTGIFGIYNGDSGFVTLNGKGFNFLLSDAISKTVRINVGTDGKYWEFSTTGIKFCNANGTATNWVRLVNE